MSSTREGSATVSDFCNAGVAKTTRQLGSGSLMRQYIEHSIHYSNSNIYSIYCIIIYYNNIIDYYSSIHCIDFIYYYYYYYYYY
eukprot:gene3643-biopygen4919